MNVWDEMVKDIDENGDGKVKKKEWPLLKIMNIKLNLDFTWRVQQDDAQTTELRGS